MCIVLYHSNYGHTQRYAEWIGEALNCPVHPVKDLKQLDILSYNTVIYGESIYAGSYSNLSKFGELMDRNPRKNYIFFSVSVSDVSQENTIVTLKENIAKSLSEAQMTHLKKYYFRGGLDYSKLNFVHSAMMWMLIKMLKREKVEERSKDNQEMIDNYKGKVDYTDKDSILPLVQNVKSITD